MAEIYLIKTLNGFKPAYDSDIELAKKFKVGEAMKVKFSQPRNYKFHKKFMSLIKLTFDNEDNFKDFNQFRKWVTMKSGHYVETKTPDGVMYDAKSISFASMDEIEFEKVFNSVLDFCADYLGAENEDIRNEIINYA